MSLRQNFKANDHGAEMKILLGLLLMSLGIGFFFLVGKLLDRLPEIHQVFLQNGSAFGWFFAVAVVLSLGFYLFYARSLDFWESETRASARIAFFWGILWGIFWIAWSIHSAWMTLHARHLSPTKFCFILALTLLPGLIAFIFSRKNRREDKQEEAERKGSEPFTLGLERKYYMGYYGLICLPAYLLALFVGYFLR